MGKMYKVPVAYEMYGYVIVEGESPEDAMKYATENIDDLPLPDDGYYVEDSYEVDTEGAVIEIGTAKVDDEYDLKTRQVWHTNNQKLAEDIYNLEHPDVKTARKWREEGRKCWELSGGVTASLCSDGLCWYLSKPANDYSNSTYVKIIQRSYWTKRTIEQVLDAMPWEYV